MKLADHWDDGNEYLKAGWYTVRVTGYEDTKPTKKGTKGVEFQLTHASGKIGKTDAFWFTPDAAKILVSFAKACGLTQEDLTTPDFGNDPRAPEVFMNRTVRVGIVRDPPDSRYHKAVEWAEEDGSAMPQMFKRLEPVAQADTPTTGRDSDIPF
jgi:hypothetical protein